LLKSVRRKPKLYRTNYNHDNGKSIYSWEDLFGLYINAKEAQGLAKGTIQNNREYQKLLMTYLTHRGLTDLKPHEFKVEHVRDFIAYLRNEHVKYKKNHCVKQANKTVGVTINYVNTVLKSLRPTFSFFVEEGYIDENPFRKVPLLKEERDTVEALTMQQVSRLLKAPDKRTYAGFRDYVLLTLLVDTGMRIGEALNLRFDHINFKSNVIEIPSNIAKNRKTRHVPISNKTSRLLRELRAEVEELHTPYVFVSCYGNQLDDGRIRSRLRDYGELAGLKGVKLTPHVLRHTFAKYYLLNNGDIMTLQKILGHSTLDMVRRYVQMTERDMKHQHSKFSPLNLIQ